MNTAVTSEAGAVYAHGDLIDIPLNRLKASPRNARRTPHTAAFIEAMAASIAVKGVLQPPRVEPERDAEGRPTGCWLATIGEGRRQALRLLAKRREIRKTHPVRCVVDLDNDPQEISLDENVTRQDMSPADQFEAFRDLARGQGLGAEEIAARFGVSAQVVRQRLRLAAVSPQLMQSYREGGLVLDQLMAFAVSGDQDRQMQVFERLAPHGLHPHSIRRAMTETKVSARDRRAVFVGVEAYEAAGGAILRDLFVEDGGGWLEDVGLLDRLAAEKLAAMAADVRDGEGWKWAEAHLDHPHHLGFARVYPVQVERDAEVVAQMSALTGEYDRLIESWDSAEELPAEVEARLGQIEAVLAGFGEDYAFLDDDRARGGVFVVLGGDGQARIERGFIRPEDAAPAPEAQEAATDEEDGSGGERDGADAADAGSAGDDSGEEPAEGGASLSERLVLDLTAHRTLGLRDALARSPSLALTAVAHALALRAFFPPYDFPSPLEIRAQSAFLSGHAPGLEDTPAGRRIAERHAAWASRLPRETDGLWAFVSGLDGEELLALLAHCAGLTVNAVHSQHDRRTGAWALADRLAAEVGLDMAETWTATRDSYLGRVTKGHILTAVREACGEAVAERLAALRKTEMVEQAETLLAGSGWLPPLLRTPAGAGEAAAAPEPTRDREAPADMAA